MLRNKRFSEQWIIEMTNYPFTYYMILCLFRYSEQEILSLLLRPKLLWIRKADIKTIHSKQLQRQKHKIIIILKIFYNYVSFVNSCTEPCIPISRHKHKIMELNWTCSKLQQTLYCWTLECIAQAYDSNIKHVELGKFKQVWNWLAIFLGHNGAKRSVAKEMEFDY